MAKPLKKQSVVGAVLTSLLVCIAMDGVCSQERETLVPAKVEDGPPAWLKNHDFPVESFTFVRLRYDEPVGRWATDYPDADLNFANRLKDLTSLDVAPDGLALEITDPRLAEYPFAYLSANGPWEMNDKQAVALRRYLEGGGFLMVDDLWGEAEWANTVNQMARVLPDRKPVELPIQHRIFHCVYDLKEKPQVCGIFYALQGRARGISWERTDAKDVNYFSISNDEGRMLVLICRNTDLADGWERVEDDAWYAQEFSEKRAFPMGINAVFYVLTAAK